MNPSEGLEEFVDASLSNLYDDGESAAGALLTNQAATGASHATNASEKRGRIPLDNEEKKKRKKIADKKHREKCKAIHMKTKEELQSANEQVKYLKSEIESLKEERNSMAQELENSKIQNGRLQSTMKSMHETIVDQKQRLAFLCRNQDGVGKMEEKLQDLKAEICKLEHMNRSLKAEKDTMTDNIENFQLEIFTLKGTISSILQQQQRVDLYSNGLNCFQELSTQQEQLWQEENGSLGFVGDGGPIVTSVSEIQPMMDSEMSQLAEKWKREAEEARNDRAETKKQLDEVHAKMHALEARMFEYMKSRNA